MSTELNNLKKHYDSYLRDVATMMPFFSTMKPGTERSVNAAISERERGKKISGELLTVRDMMSKKVAEADAIVESTTTRVQQIVIAVLLVGFLVLMALATWISRLIKRPVTVMVNALKALARKDLIAEVDIRSDDELGEMGRLLNQALTSVREAIGTLAESSTTLATSSQQLNDVSAELGSAAEATAEQTTVVSESATAVASSVESMSAATDQMMASIGEIAGQASRASDVASDAVRTAAETSSAVMQLDRASAEIGEIVRVITMIAEQTNLLALNATIEAARAGDAGRGFAVVASEVKDLAQETSRATDDITAKITAMQATTSHATSAIDRITSVINSISENQNSIASSVEEQSSTTSEIGRNVSEVANGATQMASTIHDITGTAGRTSDAASATRRSSEELSQLADRVHTLVGQFTF
ncbi:MAG: methyl-accepting chemotaxis protein [Actinomycetota bacterium]|nr:methyl-accepting chemotaxis protein [Actinomycetota bacterium]